MSKANSWLLMGVVVAVGVSAWSAASHAEAQGRAAAGAAANTATGQFTVNGKAVTLTSSVARTVRDSFEPTKTGYTLILSDVKGLPDKYGSLDKVTAGTLHFIELTLGADKSVYGAILHHSAFKNGSMTASGGIKLDVEKYGPDVLVGKVSTTAPKTVDGTTVQFTATFTAQVEKEK